MTKLVMKKYKPKMMAVDPYNHPPPFSMFRETIKGDPQISVLEIQLCEMKVLKPGESLLNEEPAKKYYNYLLQDMRDNHELCTNEDCYLSLWKRLPEFLLNS